MRISLEALSSLSISKGCCRWAPSKMPLGAKWKTSKQSEQWNLWLVTSWDGTWSIFKQEKTNGGLVTNFNNNSSNDRQSWFLTGVCLSFLSLDRLSDWIQLKRPTIQSEKQSTSYQTHSILDQKSWLACREICLDRMMARGYLVCSPSYKIALNFEESTKQTTKPNSFNRYDWPTWTPLPPQLTGS